MQKEIITLRVSPETKNKLVKEASKNQRTISFLANQILTNHYEQDQNTKPNKQIREVTKSSSMPRATSKRRFN